MTTCSVRDMRSRIDRRWKSSISVANSGGRPSEWLRALTNQKNRTQESTGRQRELVLVGIWRDAVHDLRMACREFECQLHLVQRARQGSDSIQKPHHQRL